MVEQFLLTSTTAPASRGSSLDRGDQEDYQQHTDYHGDTAGLIAAHHAEQAANRGSSLAADQQMHNSTQAAGHGGTTGQSAYLPPHSLATSSNPDKHPIPPSKPYMFERHYARATLNTFGPLLVCLFYLFIVLEYFLRTAVNDISPPRIFNGKAVFYTWLIFSIFLLDWAKSGLAGFEAAALMKPRLAPCSAMQLMWHLDRGWGGLSGWWKATTYTFRYWRDRFTKRPETTLAGDGPGGLWWYLAFSSMLFYIAVPLSGISMDITQSFQVSKRPVTIEGPNRTTFDATTNLGVADLARSSWRRGLPTTPLQPSIFYAMATNGSNVTISDTFFEDAIQEIYRNDSTSQPGANRAAVTFFAGPRVAQYVQGVAWGLLTSISCSPINIYHGLRLIKINSREIWTNGELASDTFTYNLSLSGYGGFGLFPQTFLSDSTFGVAYEYLLASDREIMVPWGEYAGTGSITGSFELATWQQPLGEGQQVGAFRNLSMNPMVEASGGFLGYGVTCEVTSATGVAHLDAAQRTYSDFTRQPSDPACVGFCSLIPQIWEYSGLGAIQSIVLVALSYITPGNFGAPGCIPTLLRPQSDASLPINPTCNLFYSANLATDETLSLTAGVPGAQILSQPIIDPPRMTLAMYKIFGETASAMMAVGGGNWTSSTLTGVEPISDIAPGRVSWQLVFPLLLLWLLVTAVPQCWTFAEKRWSSTLEAFEMFRFGAEWREAVQRFESNEYNENTILRQLPGMVGDMEAHNRQGFVGLSRMRAEPNRRYQNSRGDLHH